MNAAFVLSRHGSLEEITKKMGGGESFMVELFVIKKYAERFERVFVFSHDRKKFEDKMPENCSHVRFFHPLIYTFFGCIIVTLFALRHNIKVVYVESITGMIPALFVNRLTNAKVILDYLYLWHMTAEGFKKRLLKKAESFLIKFSDYFIAANSDIVRFIGRKGEILKIGANALLIDCFDKACPDKGLTKIKGKKIIFVGRLIDVKDPLTMINAFRIVRRKFPSANLIICGDGELKDKCEEIADGNVHFLGFVKDIPSLLKASDIFAMSSVFDASPRALVEAMGSGLPIVATRVGGIPDYLDENAGIMIEPGDSRILADKLIYLLSNPEKSKKLGDNARKKVLEKYDLEKNVKKQLDFIEKELKS